MKNVKKNPSIKYIAELAGVSVATVSRVLNNTGRFSRETEKKIRRIVTEQGYVPNRLAKNLRTNTTQTIGVIVPDISNEFYARIVWEIEQLLFAMSYTVLICNTNEDKEREKRYFSLLTGSVVDGILCATCLNADEPQLDNLGIPIVYFDRHPLLVNEVTSFVTSDHTQGAYLATKELIFEGRTKIALLIDKRKNSTQIKRYSGYYKALNDFSITYNPDLVVKLSIMDYKSAYDATLSLLNTHDVDGIFASTDWVALGAVHAIKDMGIECPHEISLVGFDDISISKFCEKPITTIRQECDVIAEKATKKLFGLIEKTGQMNNFDIIPVTLLRRQTTL